MPQTRMIPVESSNVAEIGYAYVKRDLYVRYLNQQDLNQPGKLYVYHKVPRSVFDNLKRTDSVGEYLNDYVKDVYQYELLG